MTKNNDVPNCWLLTEFNPNFGYSTVSRATNSNIVCSEIPYSRLMCSQTEPTPQANLRTSASLQGRNEKVSDISVWEAKRGV